MLRSVCTVLMLAAVPAAAQVEPFGQFGKGVKQQVTVALIADQAAVRPGQTLRIGLLTKIPDTYYVYYRTPGDVALTPRIALHAPEGFEVGPLQWPAPDKVKPLPEFGEGMAQYVHTKDVLVYAAVKVPADLPTGGRATFTADVELQFCDQGSCLNLGPKTEALTLPVAADAAPSAQAERFAQARKKVPGQESEYVTLSATLSQDRLRPGDKAVLFVAVDIAEGHKIQQHDPPVDGLVSTDLIVEPPPGVELERTLPTYPPPQPGTPIPGLPASGEYSGQVVIAVPVNATAKLEVGKPAAFRGLLRFQACTKEGACYPPETVALNASIPTAAAGGAAGATKVDGGSGLAWFLVLAFVGGFVLNFMPCVLPVIGIKLLSFSQQAGESRGRLLALNLSYTAGVLAVFLGLATIAVILQQSTVALAGGGTPDGSWFGWIAGGLRTLLGAQEGEEFSWGYLFGSSGFNLAMAGMVFVFALSLLGVFEIPVPGFVGAGGAQAQEGLPGAALTGVFATLLATPCTGPFMGSAIAWSVVQPPATIYSIFGVMGLGMALPYLLVGAFPALISWLPKPGAWMIVFKQAMGFLLLATVVFLLGAVGEDNTTFGLTLMLGLGVACWIVGAFYDYNAGTVKRLVTWVGAAHIAAFVAFIGMVLTAPPSVQWQEFSDARLADLMEDGETVVIDFTADWCVNCKTNERLALHRDETSATIERLDVVPLVADYTDRPPEILRWLTRFGVRGIPLTVVIPHGRLQDAIVLDGLFGMDTLIEKLETAAAEKVQVAAAAL